MHQSIRILFAGLCLASLSLAAGAADNGAEKAIRARISVLEKAWEKGNAELIATQVYGADAVIHGEGQKELIQSPDGVLAVVKHLVADSRSVKLNIHSIRNLGPGAAHSWVTWHVVPRAADQKPFDVRALFVWTKGKEGWRIRADMYSMGGL